ncbi:MAG: hypothetical protein Q8Q08_03905 [Candidatus Omnitrophota bacterium]|nr:hypothetical protein [Candidatus Omnitrophota bacterium]MDZ4242677.1 hypothetical protein [Candidatus Omnitrophota bacterium]
MRMIIFLVIVTWTIALIPLDALCEEHQPDDHHHCVLVCPCSCHAAALPRTASLPGNNSEIFFLSQGMHFLYEAPVLPQEIQPPRVSS